MKMIALSTRAERLSVRKSSIRNVSGKIDKSATWRSVLINSSSAVSFNLVPANWSGTFIYLPTWGQVRLYLRSNISMFSE